MPKTTKCDSCGSTTLKPKENHYVACQAKDSECGGSVFYCCHCVREFKDYGYLIQTKDKYLRVVVCSDCSETEQTCEWIKSNVEVDL